MPTAEDAEKLLIEKLKMIGVKISEAQAKTIQSFFKKNFQDVKKGPIITRFTAAITKFVNLVVQNPTADQIAEARLKAIKAWNELAVELKAETQARSQTIDSVVQPPPLPTDHSAGHDSSQPPVEVHEAAAPRPIIENVQFPDREEEVTMRLTWPWLVLVVFLITFSFCLGRFVLPAAKEVVVTKPVAASKAEIKAAVDEAVTQKQKADEAECLERQQKVVDETIDATVKQLKKQLGRKKAKDINWQRLKDHVKNPPINGGEVVVPM